MPTKTHVKKVQLELTSNMNQERGSRKGHQEGWQWRGNARALAKKNRAKRKHFGIDDDNEFETKTQKEFVISREKTGSEVGIVASANAGRFHVFFKGKYIDCALDSELPFVLGHRIVVGDYVTVKQTSGGLVIDHLVERKTALSRLRRDSTHWGDISARDEQIIVANIDTAVIVAAIMNPPFHPKFIDRYLVLVQHGGIKPIICLNKCDLLNERSEILAYYQKLGIQVIRTSAEKSIGIEELKQAIRGQSAVLVGHSGVGKSSLINRITPVADLRVGTTTKKTGKGRHTTTSSELLIWEANSYIIDTPGIRSLGMWDIARENLQLYFDDIDRLAVECTFADCLHDNTAPELCGVIRAMQQGSLPLQRYESYIKILREL